MPDPRWTGPPEAIAATFETGCPASVMASNAAWAAESACHEASTSLSAANSAATATCWQGMGATASTTVAFGLNIALQALVGWIAEKIAITQAAVDAFTTASSAVIPSAVCQANRDEWATANATNFLGMRTPEIVALDTEYFGEHWPHNSSVGWTYSGALSALTAALAMPPPIAPPGASPAAPVEAGEAVAQAAAQTGMSDAAQASGRGVQTVEQLASAPADSADRIGSLAEPLQQGISGAAQPMAALAQLPAQVLQGTTSMPQTFLQSFGGMFPTAAAPDVAAVEPSAGPGAGGAVTGSPGAAGSLGGYPGAGLTSYSRPNSSFDPPTSGRPTGLRADLLKTASDLRGPTASAAGGAAMPMSPLTAQGRGRSEPAKELCKSKSVVAQPGQRS